MNKLSVFTSLLLMAFLSIGCKKDPCKNCADISWTEYNTVSQVTQYFNCHVDEWNNRREETLLVTGYIDETFESISRSAPILYLSDKYYPPYQDYGHPQIIGTCSRMTFPDTLLESFRTQRVYATLLVNTNCGSGSENPKEDYEPKTYCIVDIDTLPIPPNE